MQQLGPRTYKGFNLGLHMLKIVGLVVLDAHRAIPSFAVVTVEDDRLFGVRGALLVCAGFS